MLHLLAYTSASVGFLEPTILDAILEVSQVNNKRDGITGILMYNDRLFFQILEGRRSLVEDCYTRICLDNRHKATCLMYSQRVEVRAFSGWGMRYVGPEEIGRYEKSLFQDIYYLMNTPKITTGMALRLLKGVGKVFPYT